MTSTSNDQFVTPSTEMNNVSIVLKQWNRQTRAEFLEPPMSLRCINHKYMVPYFLSYTDDLVAHSVGQQVRVKLRQPEFHLMYS